MTLPMLLDKAGIYAPPSVGNWPGSWPAPSPQPGPQYVGFLPTDLASCILWVPAWAQNIRTNALVSTALDFSGAGNNLTQTTVADQPTFLTNQIGGLPVFSFDMVDDFLSFAGPASWGGGGCTIFVVVQTSSASAIQNVVTDAGINVALDAYTGDWGFYSGMQFFAGAVATTPTVVCAVVNGASSSVAVNGSATTGTINVFTESGFTVADGGGSGHYFGGLVAEVVVFNAVLTAAQIGQVTSYLGATYGIAV